MKARIWLLPLFVGWLAAASGFVSADGDSLPMPRILDDTGRWKFSPEEFERLLQQLKAERDGLDADWKALLKRNTKSRAERERDEKQIQMELRQMLKLLQQGRTAPEPAPRRAPDPKPARIEAPADSAQHHETAPAVPIEERKPAPVKTPGPIDVVSEGHALFRLGRYEEALASFRQVDLKGKKAEARAPIQYLTAISLLHLGKTDEALPILREVANSRGDERFAGYAQWQLEFVRWQMSFQDSLGRLRQRRLGLEKRS